jgi:hypothetical protein
MKRIFCEIHLFDLNQKVYIIDSGTGNKELIATTTMEGLPEAISAISGEKKIPKVFLAGNSILGATVAEDIVTYSKLHYNWNNIEVEVLK